MGELSRHLYVERIGGQRESCPLYDAIGEASGLGGALRLIVDGRNCYAPLCAIGASEMIGGRVERPGGIKMALARTGHKAQQPPTPQTPPTPPTPQYKVLGRVTLRTGLWGLDAGDRPTDIKHGTRVTSSWGTYIWTADLVPIIPDGTKVIRLSAVTPVRSLRVATGSLGGTDAGIMQGYGSVKRLSATRLKGVHPYKTVTTNVMFHDINGKLLPTGAAAFVFDMSHMNITNFGMQQVIFNVTCLG